MVDVQTDESSQNIDYTVDSFQQPENCGDGGDRTTPPPPTTVLSLIDIMLIISVFGIGII